MAPRASLRLLAFLALAGTACGEIVEPDGFSIATSTTVGLAESGASSVEAPGSGEVVTGSPLTATFVPVRPDTYVPEVLISTTQAVLLASGAGVQVLDGNFAGSGTTKAVDDLLGGLVVQRGADGGEVIWLPAQGEEPAVLDEDGAVLLDVGYVDGSPFAVVLADDELEQIRLADTERTPLLTLGEEEQVIGLSASGGLHALALANERCGELQFYDTTGTRLDLNGPGEPDCPVPRRPAYGAVALSPDGAALVYTVVTYRNDGIEVGTEIVARELSSGTIYFRRKIGEDGERITALSFDGQRVAYLLRSPDTSSVAVLELTGERQETSIELAGASAVASISFARLPLADG